MELERAFDTLGLAPGASAEDVEAAYRRLCDDFDARIGRVTSLALRDRYATARAELEAARALALHAAELPTPERFADEEPGQRAWTVLGLRPGASPLEVASAYVSLCEELDRELASSPTEALRRRCLEARAEIDAAYQHCAAAPLAAEPARSGADRYETQVAAATFEIPEPPPRAEEPARIALIREDEPRPTRRRSRRRAFRRIAVASAVLLFGAAGSLGYVWWTDPEEVQWLIRYLPLPPDPDLVEAQSAAEYLRRRVAEERRDIQRRAEVAADRVTRLRAEADAETEEGDEKRGRASLALDRAQARTSLARDLHDLTERHVFSSSALAEAYGHMELAGELAANGETDRAVAAYTEARMHLEATLASLDDAESALGSRYEAVDARDAWVALAASAGLEPGDAIRLGGQRLAEADELLEAGNFAAAIPELRRASQSFRQAFDDGRRVLAARREAFEAERENHEPEVASQRRGGEDPAVAGEAALDVSSGPPIPVSDRAEVKLVTIPSGSFLYGCNGIVDRECPASEPGRRADLPAFRIDRTEVRVSEYGSCVASGACTPPGVGPGCNWDVSERGDHPVNCIDWDQAATYCSWVGKRLPTEEEWEKAARGTDGRTYPWGNEGASCDVAVMSADGTMGCGGGSTSPVGSRDRGRSPYGLFDMAGNVLEWTGSPHESIAGARVLRGGSWQNSALAMRSSHREAAQPTLRHESVGFRCAQGAVVAGNAAP